MTEYTRRELATLKRKLKPEILRMIYEAGARGNAQDFIKWLQKYGNHLPITRRAELVEMFKQIAADEAAKRRRG